MKLYYSPGACSMASHIVMRELGLPVDLEKVDTAGGRTEGGEEYERVNPNGYVPALALDDGEVLTEGVAIMQYLADTHPDAGLVPAAGTVERARLHGHLNFIAAELHRAFKPFFTAGSSDTDKAAAAKNVRRCFDRFETHLADGRDYLLGESYSIADPYLHTLASWAHPTGIGLDDWPNLKAHVERVGQRQAVQQARAAEGV